MIFIIKICLLSLMLSLYGCGGGGSGDGTTETPTIEILDKPLNNQDTSPDIFSFNQVINAELSTEVVSETIVITGINTTVPISIVGGKYSLDNSAFTGNAGTVSSGQLLRLRIDSATKLDTEATATVTIGSFLTSFTVSTLIDTESPLAKILYPIGSVGTEKNSIIVRGNASDISGIQSVYVNNTLAISQDNFATWQAEISLKSGANEISVEVLDNFGKNTLLSQHVKRNVIIESVSALTIDPNKQIIYIADKLRNALFAIDQIKGEVYLVSSEQRGEGSVFYSSTGMTINSLGTKLYLSDASRETILEIDIVSGNRKVIASNSVGHGIELIGPWEPSLDENNGYLYYLDAGKNPALVKVNLKTLQRTIVSSTTIGTGTNLQSPHYLQLDLTRNQAYVLDTGLDQVLLINLKTGERKPANIDLNSISSPTDFSINLETQKAYVLENELLFMPTRYQRGLYEINMLTNQSRIVSSLTVGEGITFPSAEFLALKQAQSSVYISSILDNSLLEVNIENGERTSVLDTEDNMIWDDLGSTLDIRKNKLYIKSGLTIKQLDLLTGDSSLVLDKRDYDLTSDLPNNFTNMVVDMKNQTAVGIDNFPNDIGLFSFADNSVVSVKDLLAIDDSIYFKDIELNDAKGYLYAADSTYQVWQLSLENKTAKVISSNADGQGDNLEFVRDLCLTPGGKTILYSSNKVITSIDIVTGERSIIADRYIGNGPTLDAMSAIICGQKDSAYVFDSTWPAVIKVDTLSGERSFVIDRLKLESMNIKYINDMAYDENRQTLFILTSNDLLVVYDLVSGEYSYLLNP